MKLVIREPHHGVLRAAFIVSLLLILTSCASTPEDDPDTGFGELQRENSEALDRVPPQDVADALIPEIDLGFSKDESQPEPRFDVTVDRAPARDFYMSLVEGTSHSLALSPGVEGEISLSLRDVTVEDVLSTLQQAYGFGYERTRTGFLVLPAGIRTRVFRLDYLNLHRTGSSETRVSAGQLSDQANGSSNNIASGDMASGGSDGLSLAGSQIQTSTDTDLWKEVIASVQSIVGDGPGRSVVASPNAGLLVVRGIPQELASVAHYLRSAEASLNRVVILEAKILEVTLTDGIQTGINWAALATNGGSSLVTGQSGGGTVPDTGYADDRGTPFDLGPPLSDLFIGSASSAFGGVFSLAIQADNFSAFIEMLESQGNVRTLSNPRISTVNNQKAVIKVGQDEFFVTEVSTTTVTGTATTSSPNVTLTPFFSGIALDVTPQISESNDVILHVHPAVTKVVDQTKSFTIQDQLQELPLALSSIRETDSIVRAKSGQVVVIGGLILNNKRDDSTGIPFIKRIPWIGRIFEHSDISQGRTELVILLRPVVVDNGTWENELRSTSHRLNDAFEKGRKSRDKELGLGGWLPPTPPVSR